MAKKKFKHAEIEHLHRGGYKPRIVKGEVVCMKEPPAAFNPSKTESLKQKLDKKRDK